MTRKVWMITGASRGIGAEIAKAVLAAGDPLAATARGVQGLDHLGSHENLFTVGMDVTSEPQVKTGMDAALQRFGRIDVLVGMLNVTRAVLPGMREHRAGHIINISSVGGYRASAGWGVYCSTKFAVEELTEALHDELAPLGIHATVVEPGRNHQQPGDPAKPAQAIVQIASAVEPPLRLPLGTDTLRVMAETNAFVERETAQWRTLAESTDFPN